MPDTVTPKLALTKPEIGASSNSWGNKLNANMDKLDNVLSNTAQWNLVLGDGNPASTGGPFLITRYNNSGIAQDTPISINRQTGDITIPNNIIITKDITVAGKVKPTGAIEGTTMAMTGAVTAASFAATGSISGANVTASGVIQSQQLISTVNAEMYGTLGVGGVTTLGVLNAGATAVSSLTVGGVPVTGGGTLPTRRKILASGNYTVPAGCRRIFGRMVAGGGEGGGAGSGGADGAAGGTTVFHDISAVGGSGGIGTANNAGGIGGTGGSDGSTAIYVFRMQGNGGASSGQLNALRQGGGAGGGGPFGGGGKGPGSSGLGGPGTAAANSGGGGGGATGVNSSGGGGGAGEYVEFQMNVTGGQVISVTIGAGAPQAVGYAGGSGVVLLEELY